MAGESILVIDDSIEILNLIDKHMLSPLGFAVSRALDGRTGLGLAVQTNPDLILVDLNMPQMGGLEVLAKLRQADCRSPAILMTAFGSETVAVEAFRLGVRDYITKPFTGDEIQQTVDRALHESRLAREREELNRRLLTAEAVRVTVITLSHYLNNNLMAINGALALLCEALEQDSPEIDLYEIIQKGREGVRGIQAVMNILLRTTDVRLTPYSTTSPMIDIAEALDLELKSMSTAPLQHRKWSR